MLTTYVSLLRGINVSGHKIIKMDDLRQSFAELEFQNIRTYIQSGNVIFQDEDSDVQNLEKIIQNKIFDKFRLEVPVLVKEITELKEIINNNPFTSRKDAIAHSHVTFLSSKPLKEDIDNISDVEFFPDEFVIIDKIIYLFCPNGYGKTRLTNNFFETKLKVSATTRNLKTLNKLVNIAEK